MTPDWSPLRDELAVWQAAGRTPRLWWRDDDATEPTAALDRLEDLARRVELPVHLAVIPKGAGRDLAHRTATARHLVPVVHGWAHANHAPQGVKKSEFGQPRCGAREEIAQGLTHLRALFGDDLVPLFVPPWNRLHDSYLPVLADLGFSAVSAFGPAPASSPLPVINTHLDPIDWRGTRGLVPPDDLIRMATAWLQEMRVADVPVPPPFGLLTHHLVHDDAIWSFCETFLHEMLAGGATPWTFPQAPKGPK